MNKLLMLTIVLQYLLLSHHTEAATTASKQNTRAASEYCYSSDTDPYLSFSSKTNYKYTHGDLSEVNIPTECVPVQLWSFNRHGTRYASKSQLSDFKDLKDTLKDVVKQFKKGKGTLCEEDFQLLSTWEWDKSLDKSIAKELTPQGYQDLVDIAQRFKAKYPTLLNVPYSEKDFYFQYAISNRVRDSYKGYVEGLFGADSEAVKGIESDVTIEDIVDCAAWNKAQDDKEAKAFRKSDEYKKTRQAVADRLGFSDKISKSLLETIYYNCNFEKAWYVDEISKWCVAFSEEDLKILEYEDDLDTYYTIGYGDQYSPQTGCPLLKDFYTKFNSTIHGEVDVPKVTALFSHHDEVVLLLTALGLFKDNAKPTSENYSEEQNRLWRTSYMSPFATNFVAVLYECGVEYKIQFLLNERPLDVLEDCSEGLCSWSSIKSAFDTTVQTCNLSFCGK